MFFLTGVFLPTHVQGFTLTRSEERQAVLACLTTFLDALDTITSAQRSLRADTSAPEAGSSPSAMTAEQVRLA